MRSPRRGADQLVALRDGRGERLLAEHVLPGVQSSQRELVVGAGGRRDDDRVDIVGREHLAEIGRGAHAGRARTDELEGVS